MTLGWQEKPFESCLDRFKVTAKIPKKQFADAGQFPIVSQEADFINGYWENEADVCSLEAPVVIYGDHTQVVKYVDFDFVVGADGVKVLKPKDFIDPRFLYYFVMAHRVPSLGYARHYRHLKDQAIKYPPLEEQQRIVTVLDEAFEGLARARAHAEANLENTNELFRNTLAQRTNSEDFRRVMLSEVCDVRDGTHDTPKYVDEGVPLVTQKNIRPEGLSLENVKLISHDNHTAIHRRSNVAEGDILISMIGVNRGMSCLVDRDDVFSIKNVGLIKDTPELNMDFLLYYLKSADAEKYVEEATNGGAQPFIGLGKLRAFPTPVPERAVQDRIAAELTEMREAVQALAANYEAQIKDFDDLRQSLLQKAFAGELT